MDEDGVAGTRSAAPSLRVAANGGGAEHAWCLWQIAARLWPEEALAEPVAHRWTRGTAGSDDWVPLALPVWGGVTIGRRFQLARQNQ